MFVDASALTAILIREADADEYAARLEQAGSRATSPLVVWETATAITRALGISPPSACQAVIDYLAVAEIRMVAVAPEAAMLAMDAFDRYGKGRHKAGLNFGDCFSYACARQLGLPLLYKGGDFALTDIEPA